LLLNAGAGFWTSRRALAPAEQIRREADAIDPADLTARLQVPRHDDELGKLARTLNSLLARIERGFRSVEQFTADASHELRAPLAFIITAGDVSLRRQRSREELVESLSKIIAEALRMSKLVEDLLVLARGDARQLSQTMQAINLNRLVEETVDRMAAAAKDLEFKLALPERVIEIDGVESDVRRLILILLDNAIKYTDKGTIRITLAAEAASATVTISDTGLGIEPSALPHIFDRFWRADKVRSRAEGGVGLGLSLAAQIVQRHHGTIAVDSVLGKGTTFTVKL
jgi:signal transduction histidine kinase